MNLSLIQRLKSYLRSNLSLTSSITLSLILCISIKKPISSLFNLLGINSYFFLFSGLFSGLVTYTKCVGNMEVPSKKRLYLSIATGAFVSIFFYLEAYSILKDISLSIVLDVLSIFHKLPGISLLHSSISGKFSINKASLSGFKDWLSNFFRCKITQGGSLNSPLYDSPSKKTTLLSERASGKKPEKSDYSYEPQQGSSRGVSASQAGFNNYNHAVLKEGVIVLSPKPGFPSTSPGDIPGYTRLPNNKGSFMYFPLGVNSDNWLNNPNNRVLSTGTAGSSRLETSSNTHVVEPSSSQASSEEKSNKFDYNYSNSDLRKLGDELQDAVDRVISDRDSGDKSSVKWNDISHLFIDKDRKMLKEFILKEIAPSTPRENFNLTRYVFHAKYLKYHIIEELRKKK